MRTSKNNRFIKTGASAKNAGSHEEGVVPTGPADTLNYIRDMVGELRDMAEEADQLLLAYLLDMAHEEARLQAMKQARQQERAVRRA